MQMANRMKIRLVNLATIVLIPRNATQLTTHHAKSPITPPNSDTRNCHANSNQRSGPHNSTNDRGPCNTSHADDYFSDKSLSYYLSKLRLPSILLPEVKKKYFESEQRIWVIDNSAAMLICDYQLMDHNGEMVDVSRWEGLSHCVCFHAKMGARVGMETKFQFLNKPDSFVDESFSVGQNSGRITEEIEDTDRIMDAVKPRATQSPLVEFIHYFVKVLSSEQIYMLRKEGRFISLILATQGVPACKDGKAEPDAYRALEKELYYLNKLPVKLVIRLCTGDEETVRLYNEIDSKLDNCDIIRYYQGEATEVYLYNPWLTYSIGLHRLREAGLALDDMDLLDEETLSFGEATLLVVEQHM
jgi:hypothetical protein